MDQVYKQIVQFQYKCNDYIDDHSASSATSLKQEVQRLEDEAQVKKNPISLENRVKTVIQLLEKCGESNAISHGHVQELVRTCDNLREQLRKV